MGGGLGTLTGYMIFIGGLLAQVVGLRRDQSYIPVVFIAVFIILPLTWPRRIHALRFASLAGVLAMMYIVVMYAWFKIRIGSYDIPSDKYVYVPPGPLELSSQSISAVNLLIGAFCVQNTCLPVYAELVSPTPSKMLCVTMCAMGVSFAIYELIGLSGYLMFGGNVESNSLLTMDSVFQRAHPWTVAPIFVAKLSMSLNLSFVVPLAIWPCRSAICSMITQIRTGHFAASQGSDTASSCMFRCVTLCILVVVVTLAQICPDVTVPLGLANSLAGGSMIFIMPGLFYLGSIERNDRFLPAHWSAMFMIVLGVFVCVLGFSLQITSLTR